MRHQKRTPHLGRNSAHRKAMLSNMAVSLILHKRITTTLAKAKALRSYIEPLITTSKEDTTHSRRHVFSYLQSKEAVSELFREISQKVIDRPGGYTRILKLGPRLGDNSEMAMIELVDFNELMLGQKEEQKGKSTRRRRSVKKKDIEPGQPEAKKQTEPVAVAKEQEEEVAAEEPEAAVEQSEEAVEQPEEAVDQPAEEVQPETPEKKEE